MEGLIEVGPDPESAERWTRPEAPRRLLQPARLTNPTADWFAELGPATRAAIVLAGALCCAAAFHFLF